MSLPTRCVVYTALFFRQDNAETTENCLNLSSEMWSISFVLRQDNAGTTENCLNLSLEMWSISFVFRQDNAGTTENCLNLSPEVLSSLTVDHVDIGTEPVPEHKYKESEDLKIFKSKKTGRGPLKPGWKESKAHPGNWLDAMTDGRTAIEGRTAVPVDGRKEKRVYSPICSAVSISLFSHFFSGFSSSLPFPILSCPDLALPPSRLLP